MKENETKKRLPKWLRILYWVFIVIALLLLIMSFTLTRPKFQNWAVDYVSERLSERLDVNITVDSVSLDIQRGVKVWNISGIGMKGDTLFSGSEISSSLTNNLISAFRNELYLSDIYLKDIYVNVEQTDDDIESNWQSLLRKFQTTAEQNLNPDQTLESKKSLLLEIETIELQNLKYRNKTNSVEQIISLANGKITLDSINLDSLHFFADKVQLVNPVFIVNVDNIKSRLSNLQATETQKDQITINNESNPGQFPWLKINNLDLRDGTIKTKNEASKTGRNEIDYSNIQLEQLSLEASDIEFESLSNITAKLENLSGLLDQKLELEKTSFSQLVVSEKKIELSNFNLKTPKTYLNMSNTLKFRSLEDFKNFNDKVYLDLDFNNSDFSIEEIKYLLPGIAQSEILLNNSSESIKLNGQLKGRVNNFSTTDLNLKVGDKILFDGKVRVRNITDPSTALINIEVDRLITSISDLTKVIPNFRPPENFFKLGSIDFNGRFDGFVYNFVAFGELKTALGNANSDMQLDLSDGRNNAKYSGALELVNFNLKEWSGNQDFEFVNLKTNVKNGSGLVLSNAKADLDATLNSFSYKGHIYEDLVLNGVLEKNQFDGQIIMRDENANFDFDGIVTYENEIFNGDFKSKINRLDLKELNLSKKDFSISGDIDLRIAGNNIDNLDGEAFAKDLIFVLDGRETSLDSAYLISTPDKSFNRLIRLESDLVNLSMDGKINFKTMKNDLQGLIFDQHPEWSEYLGLQEGIVTKNQNFNFDVEILDSENIFAFLGQPDLSLNGFKARGLADSNQGKLQLSSVLDSASFKQFEVQDLALDFLNLKERSGLQVDATSLLINENSFKGVDLDAALAEDGILFVTANSGNLLDTLGQIDLTLDARPNGKELLMHLKENDWSMLGTNWTIDKSNEIVLGEKSLIINDLNLSDGERDIEIQSRGNQDLLFHVSDVDLSLINPFVDDPKFLFGGATFVNFQILQIFDNPSIQGSFVMPELLFNDDPYGELNLLIENLENNKLKVDLNLIRDSDDQMVVLDATVDSKTQEIEGILTADNFALKFFEYIILDGISETSGHFDLACRIKGKLLEPKLNGRAIMQNGAVRVDYIGNKVFFDDQEVRLNEKVIDVTGGIITDRLGNEAVLTGGLYHDFLRDFTMGLNISSDNFLLLDTDKRDNPDYYGIGIGQASVDFNGPFELASILVNATTNKGSFLNIPVVSSVEGYDESFIQFVEKGELLKVESETVLRERELLAGANIEINLSLTPDAEVNIIFNEQLNDVITGRGRGNIKVISERTGTFDIFGQYTVESGKYLFTALGIVAKPFQVERGGTVTWTGDPLNAELDIEAVYTGLRTSTEIFLEEYLGDVQTPARSEAERNTDVLLGLNIKGTLFEPDINFDLSFPELQGEVKSYADSKMRTLRATPTDLNDQVAGLLIFGSFLPSDNPYSSIGGDTFASGYNTLSEFVSNQLSYLLSGLFEETLIDNNVLSGIDLDIGFSKRTNILGGPSNSGGIAPDEVELVVKPQFKNDRFSADLGTNYVRVDNSGIGGDGSFYDFKVEYSITADRRLKARVFAKNDFDLQANGNENQYGVGIRYSKEFGTLAELREIFQEEIKADLKTQKGN